MRIIFGFLVVVLAGTAAPAQDEERDGNPGFDLDGASLEVITRIVQRETKKTFLWSSRVPLRQRTVNFKSDLSLRNPELLFKVYQHMLQVSGFSLIRVGEKGEEIYKVLQSEHARKNGPEIMEASGNLQARYVTRLFSLKHVSPRDVHAALLTMATHPQNVLPLASAGILMVTDYDFNIARFESIIKKMDVKKPGLEMRMIPLKHAVARNVERVLAPFVQKLVSRPASGSRSRLPGAASRQETIEIGAYARTNSLLVLAEPNRLEQIIELVARMDSETSFETSGIHIFHLRHTDAVDISRTVNAMYGVSVDDRGMPSAGDKATKPGEARTSAQNKADDVPKIVADIRSNSIISVTDRNTYKTLEAVMVRLDSRRPQVLIKATVVEISHAADFDLGTELNALFDPARSGSVAGNARIQFDQSTLVIDPSTGQSSIIPVDTAGITLAILKDRFGNVAGFIKALDKKVRVSVLDEPEVVTEDNGFAVMSLKVQIPVLRRTFVNNVLQETFDRFEEAETTLSVSPHISEGGSLRLNISVKIEKFAGVQTNPTLPPPKTTRVIKTSSIRIPNGRTVVIGGIVTQDESETIHAVPFLSKLPIIGPLFQRRQKRKERRTLYIFITPYILYDNQFGDFKDLTAERKDAVEILRGRPLEGLNLKMPKEPGVKSMFQFPIGSPDGTSRHSSSGTLRGRGRQR